MLEMVPSGGIHEATSFDALMRALLERYGSIS